MKTPAKFLICFFLFIFLVAGGCTKQAEKAATNGSEGPATSKPGAAVQEESGAKNTTKFTGGKVTPELRQAAEKIAPHYAELESIVESMDNDYKDYKQGRITRRDLSGKYLEANNKLQDLNEIFKDAENSVPPEQKEEQVFKEGLSYAHDISINSALFVTKVVTGDSRVPLKMIASAPAYSDEKLENYYTKFLSKKGLLPDLKLALEKAQK